MKTTSLNGIWTVDWLSEQPYLDKEEPAVHPSSGSATPCPLPGYWEDMTDLFRTTALHTKLRWNPLYTLQRYPQAGYVPDLTLPNPLGCFACQKTLVLSEAPRGEAELSFGGVQNAVSAWINGRYLGRHEGYSAPFSFPVPAGVLTAGENRVTLAVSNHRLAGYMGRPVVGMTSRMGNECTGGIYGDVELRVYPDGMRDVWVTTSEDCRTFTVHVTGAADREKTVRILDGEKCVRTAEIPAGKSEAALDADGLALWSPESPKLYTAAVSTDRQTLTARFGIRRLTVRGRSLFLNGKPFYFRGTCEHCYYPFTVHPIREKNHYRAVIRKQKELGFNAIRFHTYVPPVEYMEAADELGIVMEVETPNNTSFAEWKEIVPFCRRHPAVNLYSTGNEMQIDEEYLEHLRACAALVHGETDSLFSPMSAMRGIEYCFVDEEYIDTPFRHNPRRLGEIGRFSDVYNSYSLGLTSYDSATGTHEVIDERNRVYDKPLFSHEIGIHGTYIDLSLEERYKGTRMGDTEFMSSVRRHLTDKGLIDRANLYYRNSSAWQQILRKHCFETVRRCETFSGYDFLGEIDTHGHTFGYCVGMMNEFYELKPGETVQNVRRYNGPAVLLADLPSCVNLGTGVPVRIPVLVSNFGTEIPRALLQIRISGGGKVWYRKEARVGAVPDGALTELYEIAFRTPAAEKPMKLTLHVSLSGGDVDCENEWSLYVFPKSAAPSAAQLRKKGVAVSDDFEREELVKLLGEGRRVLLFGTGPFEASSVSWQIALAGRTNGHLATVIADHPLTEDFPHDGYCGLQCARMLEGSRSAVLDVTGFPHRPIIDVASSYKNARREAMLFEFRVGRGKLLVCTLHLRDDDPGAVWLKNRILSYAAGDDFSPAQALMPAQLERLCGGGTLDSGENENEAMNPNDLTV